MAIDIAGTILSGAAGSDVFNVDYSTTNILKVDTSGRYKTANRVVFSAGCSTQAWVPISTVGGTWTEFTATSAWNGTIINIGNGFNTTTGRFTAPVTGYYLTTFGLYAGHLSSGGPTGVGYYMYADLTKNGVHYASKPNGDLRVWGYGKPDGYQFGCTMSDVVYMIAGDYLTIRLYGAGSGGSQIYPAYSHWAGCLVS